MRFAQSVHPGFGIRYDRPFGVGYVGQVVKARNNCCAILISLIHHLRSSA